MKFVIELGIGTFIILETILKNKDVISNMSTAVTITTLAVITYCNYLWKYVPEKINKVPKLYGEWQGIIKTSYDKFENEINFKVVIKQTLLNIYIDLISEESRSESVTCELIEDSNNNFILIYTYHNVSKEEVRDRSPIHYGTARLNVISDKELAGGYFTDRKTTGTIKLKKV